MSAGNNKVFYRHYNINRCITPAAYTPTANNWKSSDPEQSCIYVSDEITSH
jgi:hypothetical protein